MIKEFQEYHQFTLDELKKLWKDSLFVFDTNALLNLYRYSRETADEFFKLLEILKKKDQLWIPYQVGYEFFENRINVISEHEKSYEEILKILNKVNTDISIKYKSHPFLDINSITNEIELSLTNVRKKIEKQQKLHPEWLKKDDVLNQLDKIFKENIGKPYTEDELEKIKIEGKLRYEKKIPPGFRDEEKSEDKKFGDLILWHQIIDKAKECKKSIILISEDLKEDWWLKKEGRIIMPLPQLKKEILTAAGVDFHIYDHEMFLELGRQQYFEQSGKVNLKAIEEVKKIREIEEEKMIRQRMIGRNRFIEMLDSKNTNLYFRDNLEIYEQLSRIINHIQDMNISLNDKEEIMKICIHLRHFRNRMIHGGVNKLTILTLYRHIKEIAEILEKTIYSEKTNNKDSLTLREYLYKLDLMMKKTSKYLYVNQLDADWESNDRAGQVDSDE